MAQRTLDLVHAIDLAWNRRQWADYAALLDDGLTAWMSGDAAAHGKAEHVLKAQRFCAAVPDAQVSGRYLDCFLSHDGDRTCSVAVLGGTVPGTTRRFEIPFAVICRWRDGRIVAQREFIDDQIFRTPPPTDGDPR